MLRRTENIRFTDLSDYDYSEGETSEDMRLMGEQQASRNSSSLHLIQTCGFNLDIDKQLQCFDYKYPSRSSPFSLPKLRDVDNQFKEFSISDKFPLSAVDPIDSVVLNCCRPIQLPKIQSEYSNNKLPIFCWQKITPNADIQNLQASYKMAYQSIKRQLHFQCSIPPTVEKLASLNSIRHDVPSGRIVFHYIGYGFPEIDSKTIYVCESKTNGFAQYPLKSIFTNIKPPSMYIFDCDNAGVVLESLKQFSKKLNTTPPSSPRNLLSLNLNMNRSVKWEDYYCLCACSEGEKLPVDRRLPRDFLTSVITAPVATAVLCHILGSYRTTIGSGEETIDRLGTIIKGSKENIDGVLSSIIDGIASDIIEKKVFRNLFREDRTTAILFRNFILAEYLLRPYSVHPISYPKLPSTSLHHLWQQWRTVCDQWICVSLVPQPSLRENFFGRAKTSLETYIQRNRAQDIPESLLTVSCHAPFAEVKESDDIFSLLAEYVSKDPTGVEKLSAAILFQPTVLKLTTIVSKSKEAHSLVFLLLALIDADRSIIAQLRPEYDFGKIVEGFFDSNIPTVTRTLFGCFLSRSLPYVKTLRPLLNTKISKFSDSLMNIEDEQFLVSLLMLISITFDNQSANINDLADSILHAQIGSLIGHSSFEVRSASVLALSGLIQGGSTSMDLIAFWYAAPSILDASIHVRYSLTVFLIRFLNSYSNFLKGLSKDQFPEDGKQSLEEFFSSLVGFEYNPGIDFGTYATKIFEIVKKDGSETVAINSAFWLLYLLTHDSCPYIKKRALSSHRYFMRNCYISDSSSFDNDKNSTGIKEKYNFDFDLDNNKNDNNNDDDSDNEIDDPSSHETSVLREAFFSQIVRAGQWSPLAQMASEDKRERNRREYGVFDLGSSHLQLRAQATVEGKPTKITFSPKSLSSAVSTEDGTIHAFDEDFTAQTSLKLPSEVSELMSVSVSNESHIVALCKDGTAHLWAPVRSAESTSWRIDFDDGESGGAVGCLGALPSLYCSRGARAVSKWDLAKQQLVGEWSFGDRRSKLTALAVSPQNENVILAGYESGTVRVFDVREGQEKPLILGLDGSILQIAPGGDGLLYIGAENGHVLVWNEDTNVIITCGDEAWHRMSQFGVHKKHPFFVMSGPGEFPVVTNQRGQVVHTFEAPVSRGSIFAIHDDFPVIAFASETGELLSFNLLQ